MFSAGHLIWIGISFIIVIGGSLFCIKKKPPVDSVLTVCLCLGIISEFIKISTVSDILPVVEPVVKVTGEGAVMEYIRRGQYTPYIELAHLPLELCSLQIIFIAAALHSKTDMWKRRFLALIFFTGVIGGVLGIVFAYPTADVDTVASYFKSLHIWQFFGYHAMLIVLSIYIAICSGLEFNFRDLRGVIVAILSMDVISIYLNSVFSMPVYTDEKPTGILYRVNFFSSYVNPLGIVLTEKWQWMLYLLIRAAIAICLLFILFALQRWLCKKTRKDNINA